MSKLVSTRRTLLGGLLAGSAGALLAPFVPRLEAASRAMGPRYCYWMDGTMPVEERLVKDCYPRNFGALEFPADKSFAAMNSFKEKLLMVRGMHRNGLELAEGSKPHVSKGVIALSGFPASGGGYFGDAPFNYGGKNASLDQWLAEKLKDTAKTKISNVPAGFRNYGGNNQSISFAEGLAVPRHRQPRDTFQALLPYTQLSGAEADGIKKLARENRSILDFSHTELTALTSHVSQLDRENLEAHSNSIRELEAKLMQIETNPGTGDALATLDDGWNYADDGMADPNCDHESCGTAQRIDLAQQAWIPLMRIALSADLTRIVGGQWGSHIQSLTYAFLGIKLTSAAEGQGGVFHAATHDGGNAEYLNGVMKYRTETFVKLLSELDSVMEPDGNTLLDNTIVHWMTEVPYAHSAKDTHTILGGGAGFFKTGEMVDADGVHNARLLREIGRAFGFEGYGLDKFSDGGVPFTVA